MKRSWFIFRHFRHYETILAESKSVAQTLLYVKRKRDSGEYYRYVGSAPTKNFAKRFIRYNKLTLKRTWLTKDPS